MGLLDRLRGKSGELKDKATDLAHDHGDKIGEGLDKAGGAVNKATKGKFEDKIDKATDKAKEGVDKLGDKGDGTDDGGPTDEKPGGGR